MEAAKFSWLIQDLEQMFGLIDTNESQKEWKIERYYEALGNEDEDALKKAVKHVIENHKFKRFPLIAELREAIYIVTEEPISIDDDDPFPCRACGGCGVRIIEMPHLGRIYPTAYACECDKGKVLKRAWQNWKKKMRR